jgi:hypothetical protein
VNLVRSPIACAALAALACSSSTHSTTPTDAAAPHDGTHDAPSPPADAAHDAAIHHDAAATPSPASVPITISSGDEGSQRFSIDIQIGDSAPLGVQLDTGSSGLRVLEGAVPDSAYASMSTTPVVYGYHSGLEISGVVATATVTIGGVATPVPIPVMYVNEVGCQASMPDCGAQGQTPETYTFFGPYKAILGVGMRNGLDGIGSAIAELPGEPAFEIESPSYGGTSGTLVLYPSADDVARYATYPLGRVDGGASLPNGAVAYDDRYSVPACVDDETSGVDYCLGSEWDTGNPPIYIEWPADTDGGVSILPTGASVKVTIGPADKPLGAYSFTVGTVPTPGIDAVEVEPATGEGFMNLGTAVFFHFDALFDQAHGMVGLAPHS